MRPLDLADDRQPCQGQLHARALCLRALLSSPLPDDLLFIPLGVMHYPFWRAFVPALFGKMLMTFILALSGQQYVDLILTLFGGSGLIGALITIILLVIVIIAMIKIDWEKLFEKQLKLNKT